MAIKYGNSYSRCRLIGVFRCLRRVERRTEYLEYSTEGSDND